jgi:hypothetical protein
VAAFVTFGTLPEKSIPVAQLSLSKDFAEYENVTGVTHAYQSPSSDGGVQVVRHYNMHFVALKGLKERTQYYYRVSATDPVSLPNPPKPPPPATTCHGYVCTKQQQNQFCPPSAPGSHGVGFRCCDTQWVYQSTECGPVKPIWSDVASFRSLYSSGETRVAIFGDMGMMSDGNTPHAAILRDGLQGQVDFMCHMGDHAVCGMVWYGMVWHGMAWYGMAWHGMVWYGMVWYGMVWYGMVWYGMVWCGMVWYGMVWYGMVWYVLE